MESNHWTGDEHRDLSPDEDRCEDCGVGPLERCTPDCQCLHCVKSRLRTKAEEAGGVDEEWVELARLKGMLR